MKQDEVKELLAFVLAQAGIERAKVEGEIHFDHSSCGMLEDHGYLLPEMMDRENRNARSHRLQRGVDGMKKSEARVQELIDMKIVTPEDFDLNLGPALVSFLEQIKEPEKAAQLQEWLG